MKKATTVLVLVLAAFGNVHAPVFCRAPQTVAASTNGSQGDTK